VFGHGHPMTRCPNVYARRVGKHKIFISLAYSHRLLQDSQRMAASWESSNLLDLMNGMHITVLTTVADDSRTRLLGGLAPQRLSPLRAHTNAISVISALPFTL
jgi:hypothetical protein